MCPTGDVENCETGEGYIYVYILHCFAVLFVPGVRHLKYFISVSCLSFIHREIHLAFDFRNHFFSPF